MISVYSLLTLTTLLPSPSIFSPFTLTLTSSLHPQEIPVVGEEERRMGVLEKSLGESHWLVQLLLGRDLSGRSHQQRGMSVGCALNVADVNKHLTHTHTHTPHTDTPHTDTPHTDTQV